MSSGANGEWVRQGTPHDDNADWNEEQSEYGTAISPTEWDDYSNEQSVPVTRPRSQHEDGDASPEASEPEPVPGQEPDAEREYRSEEVNPLTVDEPVGDADDDGMEPARLDEAGSGPTGDSYVADPDEDSIGHEPVTLDDETSRPRPVVPDASMAAVGAASVVEPVAVDDDAEDVDHSANADQSEEPAGEWLAEPLADAPTDEAAPTDEHHLDAADYFAVDPEPVHTVDNDPLDPDRDEEATQFVDTLDPEEGLAQTVDTEDIDEESTQFDDTKEADEEPAQNADAVNRDEELTQHMDTNDMESTQAMPLAGAGAAGATSAAPGAVPDAFYRSPGTEDTTVMAQDEYPSNDADVEEERLQASLEAERQAREQRLGAVPTSTDNALREDDGPPRVTTDRFFPSFGLFVMRIVLAGVLGLASFQILGSGVDATANFLGGYPVIPEPRLVAWILGFTLGAMALLLVIGLLQRLVGLLLLVISVATLVFIRWGNFAIFASGEVWVDGFIGDKDLLLAAIGLLLLSIGGGAWGIDGAFRRARAASKAERQG